MKMSALVMLLKKGQNLFKCKGQQIHLMIACRSPFEQTRNTKGDDGA